MENNKKRKTTKIVKFQAIYVRTYFFKKQLRSVIEVCTKEMKSELLFKEITGLTKKFTVFNGFFETNEIRWVVFSKNKIKEKGVIFLEKPRLI
jgi:hypothetical protein